LAQVVQSKREPFFMFVSKTRRWKSIPRGPLLDGVWWDFRGEEKEKKGGAEGEPQPLNSIIQIYMYIIVVLILAWRNTVCFQVPQVHPTFPMPFVM
jgi:hypothetical protein